MKIILNVLLFVMLLNVLQAQNVGIGVTSPLQKLHVVGNMLSENGSFTMNNASGGIIQLQTAGINKAFMQLSGNNLRMGTNSGNSNGNFIVRMNNIEHFIIDSTGKVGIGTSNVLSKLHVVGSSSNVMYIDGVDPQITFLNSGVTRTFINTSGNDLKLGTISSNDNGKLIIRTNGTDRMWVDSAGNITMGSAYKVASGYKLSVNGKVMAEGVRVQFDADWPDYVFNEEYKMKSLPELEGFIQQNKHLPNVPSAAEVAKKGIDLGEMNGKLLEKIEKLTLYIIELEKKNATVESRLSALEKNKN